MKNLLPKLRKIQEEMSGITLDIFAKACLDTWTFDYEGQDLLQRINDKEEVSLQQVTVDTGEVVYTVDYDNIFICTQEVFTEIIDSCAREYRFKYIDDLLEPFFNDTEFYKACRVDSELTKAVLEYDDISKWDNATVDGVKYVVFK